MAAGVDRMMKIASQVNSPKISQVVFTNKEDSVLYTPVISRPFEDSGGGFSDGLVPDCGLHSPIFFIFLLSSPTTHHPQNNWHSR